MTLRKNQSKNGKLSSRVIRFRNQVLTKKMTYLSDPVEKYEYIGRLLRPGETSRNYSDGESAEESSSEDESEQVSTNRPKAE